MATSIRVDALGVATFIAATALVVRHAQRPERRSLLLASAGIGVAAAANYPGALLLALLGWFEWSREGDGDRPRRGRRFVAACIAAFAVFILLNPYVLLDLSQFLRWFFFLANVPVLIHPHAPEPNPWHYLEVLRDQGVPAVVACAAALLAMLRPRQACGAVGGFAVLYLAAFSAMRTQYDRFALPAITLLCIAGAGWLYAQVAGRIGRRAAAGCVAVAVPLLLWSARARLLRELPLLAERGTDYRAEMFDWIAAHVPPTATLVLESDTLPLVQTVYDPGDPADRPFQAALRAAFERRHPGLLKGIVKAQFIAAVYNYDPSLLRGDGVFFLASSQNREFIAANRALLADPAAFYDVLDARATLVHEAGGFHERLQLYAVGAQCDDVRVDGAAAPACLAPPLGGAGADH